MYLDGKNIEPKIPKKPLKPIKDKPLDLSHGSVTSGIYNTAKFKQGLIAEERKFFPKASQRAEVTKKLLKLRTGGINPRETKRALRELRQAGKITRGQAYRFGKDLGAY